MQNCICLFVPENLFSGFLETSFIMKQNRNFQEFSILFSNNTFRIFLSKNGNILKRFKGQTSGSNSCMSSNYSGFVGNFGAFYLISR